MRLESAPRFIAAIIIFLVCLGLIVFGITRLAHHDNTSKTAQQGQATQSVQQPPQEQQSPSSSADNKTNSTNSGSSSSQPATNPQAGTSSSGSSNASGGTTNTSADNLSRTGPGDVVALFIAVSALGAGAAHLYQIHTRRSAR